MITAKRLESGWWLIRGYGPCNWAQVPKWPCSEHELERHAFPEASDGFIREAAAVAAAVYRESEVQP